jgi:hypothetical protein
LSAVDASPRGAWLPAGLFLVTLATLMLEVLDTRLLSVLTWYHLSFLAVSVAMLGMAAGAVLVFLAGDTVAPGRATRVLPGAALAFAVSLALSHVANLAIPIPGETAATSTVVLGLGIATVVLTVPFVISGVVVTIALTRTGGRIGLLYGADLLGAAVGCLAVVWVLERTDITSSALVAAACAALGALCFARHAGRGVGGSATVAAALVLAAAWNATATRPIGIIYPKERRLWFHEDVVQYSRWNAHSNVTVNRPAATRSFYWGAGRNAPSQPATIAYAAIDGMAGTAITLWDGRPESLAWTRYDVTAVPYHLRRGRAAIIGVGGGRDVLTAIAAGSTAITGIEINALMLELLRERYRDFARVAAFPGVTLVHDEARAYLTRTADRYDVLQMSLIDTWAATGAGAYTLTENGLYTRQGWRVFLRTLTPTGVFSVSRWFDPSNVSETTRLVSLGVAALIDRGAATPRAHLLLVTRNNVATLLVSPSPFTADDRQRVERLREESGVDLAVTPWHDAADGRLQRIVSATTLAELARAADDEVFDFSAPTDRRPFFFNMLKPRAAFSGAGVRGAGVVSGNLVATRTLAALCIATAALVLAIILWPLWRAGRPALPAGVFGAALAYFALIGLGFMFVQIPLLQRFSVYLGHPTYTFSILLFLMILSAGLGSLASERVGAHRRKLMLAIPVATGALAILEVVVLQPALDATVAWPLAGRTAVVAAFVTPLAFLMGHCFPLGMRLLGRHSDRVAAWMWGVNGACGVAASVAAVLVSMWIAIDAGLLLAGVLYLLLPLPMRRLGAP